MTEPLIVAIEGMPGAGKSTSLIRNVHCFDSFTHLLPETNPLPGFSFANDNDYYWDIWIDCSCFLFHGAKKFPIYVTLEEALWQINTHF